MAYCKLPRGVDSLETNVIKLRSHDFNFKML